MDERLADDFPRAVDLREREKDDERDAAPGAGFLQPDGGGIAFLLDRFYACFVRASGTEALLYVKADHLRDRHGHSPTADRPAHHRMGIEATLERISHTRL